MTDFPTDLSSVQDYVDYVWAKYLNNLEAKIGVDNSAVATTLDYLAKTKNALLKNLHNIRYADAFDSIQDAIDDLPVEGGVVQLSGKVYSVTSIITMPPNVTLQGVGFSTVLRAGGSVTAIVQNQAQASGVSCDNLVVKNIKFDSNEIATYCLNFSKRTAPDVPPYTKRVLVEGCYFYNPSIAQKGAVNVSGDQSIFTNNFIENIWIINFTEGNYKIFTGNYVKDTYDSCVSAGTGAENDWHHWVIANNVLEKPSGSYSGYCIDAFGGFTDMVIANNVCFGGNLDNIIVNASGAGPAYPGPRVSVVNNICYNAGRYGINLNSANQEYFIISGNHVHSATQHSIWVAANKVIVSNNYIESGGSGYSSIIVYGAVNASYSKISIVNNHCEDLINVYNLRESKIVGNYIEGAYFSGMHLRGIENSVIANNIIKNSGQGASATYDDGMMLFDGTYLVAGSVDNLIIGNRCFDDQGVKTQSYGVKTFQNADRNIIVGNNVRDNKDGGMSLVGSNNIVRDNLGYITENSGSSTGTGAQQTIAHGLATTPTLVLLSDKESGANPYQSAAANATNIYITAVVNQDYSWKAEV